MAGWSQGNDSICTLICAPKDLDSHEAHIIDDEKQRKFPSPNTVHRLLAGIGGLRSFCANVTCCRWHLLRKHYQEVLDEDEPRCGKCDNCEYRRATEPNARPDDAATQPNAGRPYDDATSCGVRAPCGGRRLAADPDALERCDFGDVAHLLLEMVRLATLSTVRERERGAEWKQILPSIKGYNTRNDDGTRIWQLLTAVKQRWGKTLWTHERLEYLLYTLIDDGQLAGPYARSAV